MMFPTTNAARVSLVALSLLISQSTTSGEELPRSIAYQQAVAERIREIADRVLPSIVSVETIGVLQSDGEVRQDAPTTGIVIDVSGLVLASSWVSRSEAASIIVTTAGGQRFPAKIVGRDEHRELVLLKIDPKDAPVQPLELSGATVTPPIGSTMVAIGRYGEANVPIISSGVLSAVDRLDGTAIQSDVRISPTFYGGPLLDLNGNVCGILIPAVGENGADDPTAWYDSGIAFAVPTDVIAAKIERLKNGETIRAGLMGLVVGGSDPYAPGTTISTIRKRSPADRAGLQSGDELVRVADRKVRRRQEIKLALGRFDAGDEVELEVRRGDEIKIVSATLVETIEPLRPQAIGVRLDGLKVTAVLKNSPADGVVEIGDELKRLDDVDIEDAASLRQRLWASDPDTPLKLNVLRSGDKKEELSITPQAIGGKWTQWSFDTLAVSNSDHWNASELRLPDVVNSAWLWSPAVATDPKTESTDDAVGGTMVNSSTSLLVILLPPSQRDVQAKLEAWKDEAKFQNVAICLIASEEDQKWQLSEIDAVSKLTTAAIKQSAADVNAVSLASASIIEMAKQVDNKRSTDDGNPADSMALAVSLSTDNLFQGVAIPDSTQPPAIRLRRDAPMRLLRILMTTSTDDDLPPWSETLTRIGCPIQTIGAVDREDLLTWCRSLLFL